MKLSERLQAFCEMLEKDGYEVKLRVVNHKIILTIVANDFKEALEAAIKNG